MKLSSGGTPLRNDVPETNHAAPSAAATGSASGASLTIFAFAGRVRGSPYGNPPLRTRRAPFRRIRLKHETTHYYSTRRTPLVLRPPVRHVGSHFRDTDPSEPRVSSSAVGCKPPRPSATIYCVSPFDRNSASISEIQDRNIACWSIPRIGPELYREIPVGTCVRRWKSPP